MSPQIMACIGFRIVRFGLSRLAACGLGLWPAVLAAQNPTNFNLQLVSQTRPSASPISYGDVWAEGDLACLGVWLRYDTYNYGVGIYSISNPAAPVLLSVYCPSPKSQNQFELGALRQRIGYFGSWSGGGLHIVSLTNPAAPQLLCRIGGTTGDVTNGFDYVHTVFLERDFLYEAAHVPGIVTVKVFDVRDPAAPVYLQDIVTTNTTKVHQITVRPKGDRVILYTSGWGGHDNGNPASPGQTDLWDVTALGSQPAQWLGRVYSGYNSHSSWPTEDGDTLIVCREIPGGDVRFFDVSDPAALSSNTAPFLILTPASMGLGANIPHNPVVIGNHLFLSWYQNGLQVFDIADVHRPVRIGYYDTFPGTATSSYQGNWGVFPHLGFGKLLVSDIQRGLLILDGSGLLTPTGDFPPLIVQPPRSQTVAAGAEAAFTPVVTGSDLHYQWRFNGVNLPGGTSSNLVLANVQAAQAGTYALVVSNATAVVTSVVASLSVTYPQTWQTVFADDFDTPASADDWDLFAGSGNGISDYTATWAFDYSTYYSDFHGAPIPAAPHASGGTTRGLRLTVNNNDALGAPAGVSLYPKNQFFQGAYRLTFDLWMNYPGGPGGGTGSTEHFTCGLNHTGTRVNWDSATSDPSDGIFFALDGEGGTNPDYRAYVGNPAGRPTALSFASSGFSASGATSADHGDPVWLDLFPAPPFESPGAPGKRWVTVELSQDLNQVLTWRLDGKLIAQRVNASAFTNGNVMLGYMDLFNSIATPAEAAFVLFDNVRVETLVLPAPPVISIPPVSVAVFPEAAATFSVAATGGAPLFYQWQFNGTPIPGATNNSYTRWNVQPEDVGAYTVVVLNPAGQTTSPPAVLTLLDSPYLNSVQAAPGACSALVTWATTVPADSRVQFSADSDLEQNQAVAAAQGSFASDSYLDPERTTNHVLLLTGLTPGTTYSYQALSHDGTNTYLSGVYQFTTAGALILDNAAATFTGDWTPGTSSTDKYGTDYRFAASVAGAPTATATWRPNLTTPGRYDVYIWYPQGNNRADNAPFEIVHANGTTHLEVNQKTGGGGWRLLAAGLEFVKGTSGFVRLANQAGPSVVLADAVKFEYVTAQDAPTDLTVPVWWRDAFFGGPTDPLADPDNDGYHTAREYIMGTNPTNAVSHLKFTVTVTNAVASLSFWPQHAGRVYQLFHRPELSLTPWTEVMVPPVNQADGTGRFVLAATNSVKNFYRLQVGWSEAAAPGARMAPAATRARLIFDNQFCGPYRVFVR